MEAPRFYVENLTAPRCRLSAEEAHHARHVLRTRPEDPLIVFDGRGGWAAGTMQLQGAEVFCALSEAPHQDPPPRLDWILASAVPKGQRASTLVEQASQLGVPRLLWLECAHSVVRPAAEGEKMRSWRRTAIEAAKQCGRNFVLALDGPIPLEQLLEHPAYGARDVLWADQAAAQSLWTWLDRHVLAVAAASSAPLPGPVILIGPEGDFSPRERDLLRSTRRARPVRLAEHNLRVETAALACAALLAAVGDRVAPAPGVNPVA